MGICVFLSILFLLAFVLLIKEGKEGKKKEKQIEESLKQEWKERREKIFSPYEMEQIMYLSKKKEGEKKIDDLTWDNLEMDQVFQKICCCKSTIGEEFLYFMLRNPSQEWQELDRMEKKIQCFTRDTNTFLLQKEFIKMGKVKKYSMARYLDHFWRAQGKGNLRHYLGQILLFVSIGWMNFHLFSGLFLFFGILLFQIVTYFKEKAFLDPYLVSLRYLFRMGVAAQAIIPLLPDEWEVERERLRKGQKKLKELQRNSFLLLSYNRMWGQGLEVVLDYFRMILHPDLIKYNKIVKKAANYREEITELYYILGKLDSCLSIAQYRNYLKVWTVPQKREGEGLEIKGGYHPLLENPVPNDLSLKKSLLLTGSNASGKSTFLKMMGINILLGQTIHTCLAEFFSYPSCNLFACLNLKDSLKMGESYYMAEIKAIKKIMDAAQKKERVICLIDEVLRGTNTLERIAAATEILLEMEKKDMIVLAATHDGELTYTLEGFYENYHFREEIENNDIHFSFRLIPGRAESANAIFLLSHIGYDLSMVEKAKARMEKFQKEGEWI